MRSSILHPRYRDDPEYPRLFAELDAVVNEYNRLISAHPDWDIPWLSMDLDDIPRCTTGPWADVLR